MTGTSGWGRAVLEDFRRKQREAERAYAIYRSAMVTSARGAKIPPWERLHLSTQDRWIAAAGENPDEGG